MCYEIDVYSILYFIEFSSSGRFGTFDVAWYGVIACILDDDPDDGASFSIGKVICEGFEGDGDQAHTGSRPST